MFKNTDFKISQEVLALIVEIDTFQDSWRSNKNLTAEQLKGMQDTAMLENSTFKSGNEDIGLGYREALEFVNTHFAAITVTENLIKQLHTILYKFSVKGTWRHGKYKTLPNNLEAFDSSVKKMGVGFETAFPAETPRKMQELVVWIRKTLEEKKIHPLLIIAQFTAYFLIIHPFQEGNRTVSRILISLLLLKSGYGYTIYSALETIFEEKNAVYYLALYQAQMTLKQANPDWEPWLLFFLTVLCQQKNNLAKRLEQENRLMRSLPALSARILELAQEQGRITISQIENITKSSRSSIKSRLRELIADQLLIRGGKARACWYSLG